MLSPFLTSVTSSPSCHLPHSVFSSSAPHSSPHSVFPHTSLSAEFMESLACSVPVLLLSLTVPCWMELLAPDCIVDLKDSALPWDFSLLRLRFTYLNYNVILYLQLGKGVLFLPHCLPMSDHKICLKNGALSNRRYYYSLCQDNSINWHCPL